MAVSPDEIKTVFRSADVQHKGSLNVIDLTTVLAGFTSEEEAREIVAEEPPDAEGRITYDEFVDRLCVVDAPKVTALQIFWTLAGPSGSCALADLQGALPPGCAPPPVDNSGLVMRDAFLAWLFGQECDAPTLVRLALLTRTSALLTKAKNEPTLAPVFENIGPADAPCTMDKSEWDEIMAEYGTLNANPAPARDAAHFLNVVRAGLDANAVAFPRMPRPAKSFPPAGFPSSRPSSAAKVSQQDARPFLLPHACEGGGGRRDAAPADAASLEPDQWLDGLARHVEELCAGKYEGEPLDMQVTPWPVLPPLGVIASDSCTERQEAIYAKRADKGFSPEKLAPPPSSRRRHGEEILGGELPNPRVFVEIFPELEQEAALQAVQARHDADKAAAAAAHDERAAAGVAFACWLEDCKWKPDRTFVRHGQWFARWRATPQLPKEAGGAGLPGLPLASLKRSDSVSSWLSVSDISWVEVESRAEECSWEQVIEDHRPQLQEAQEALNVLTKSSITEVKSLCKPPRGVKLVMQVVCILLEVKPKIVTVDGKKVREYWAVSTQLLGDPALMSRLTSLHYVPKSTLDAVAPFMELDEFSVENVKKVSFAAAALCEWARASFKYHTLLNASGAARGKVMAGKPKEELIAEALASLDVLKICDFQELKALGKPPGGVDAVCGCVMHLVAPELAAEHKQNLWLGCQKMMCNPAQLMCLLKQFPQSISEGLVSPTQVGRARKIADSMGELFSFEGMKCKSSACARLTLWVLNVIAYYDQINPPAQEEAEGPPAKAPPKVLDPQVLAVLSVVERFQESDLAEVGSIEDVSPVLNNVLKSVFHLLAGLAGDFAAPAADDPTWDDCKAMVESPVLFVKRLSAVPEAIGKGRLPLCHVEAARRCRASLDAEEEASSLLGRAEAANKRRWQCQAEVDEAAGVVKRCQESCDCLRKADVVELKALNCPPAMVGRVMEAVCVCLGVDGIPGPDGEPERLDYWGPSKRLLGDPGFLSRLISFRASDMSDVAVEKLQPLIADLPTPDDVKKTSFAAAGLCMWVKSQLPLRAATLTAHAKVGALEEASAAANLELEALGRGGVVAADMSAYLGRAIAYFDALAPGAAAS